MRRTKTKVRFFTAGAYQREEDWLNGESAAGWHLFNTNGFIYHFEYDPDDRYTYQLDYLHSRDEEPEKRDFYEGMGWEWFYTMFNGWVYLRKQGKCEDLYSDEESKYQFFKTILKRVGFVTIFLLAYLPAYFSLLHQTTGFAALLVLQGLLSIGALIMITFVRDAYKTLARMKDKLDLPPEDVKFIRIWSVAYRAIPPLVAIYPLSFLWGLLVK